MNYLLLVIGLGIFGLITMLIGAMVLFKKSVFKTWCIGMAGLLIMIKAALIINVSVNLLEFNEILKAKAMAKITFVKMAPQVYKATVTDFNKLNRTFVVKGDMWAVDLHLLSWSGLGMRDGYRLNHLKGRYLSLQQERDFKRESFLISRPVYGYDLWDIQNKYSLFPFVKAQLEETELLPLVDKGEFTISFFPKESSITVRPTNNAAQAAFDASGVPSPPPEAPAEPTSTAPSESSGASSSSGSRQGTSANKDTSSKNSSNKSAPTLPKLPSQ